MLGVGVRAAIVLAATSDGVGVRWSGGFTPCNASISWAACAATLRNRRSGTRWVLRKNHWSNASVSHGQRSDGLLGTLDSISRITSSADDCAQYVSPVSSVSVTCAIA